MGVKTASKAGNPGRKGSSTAPGRPWCSREPSFFRLSEDLYFFPTIRSTRDAADRENLIHQEIRSGTVAGWRTGRCSDDQFQNRIAHPRTPVTPHRGTSSRCNRLLRLVSMATEPERQPFTPWWDPPRGPSTDRTDDCGGVLSVQLHPPRRTSRFQGDLHEHRPH
jgi:hypothetical protein